MQRTSRTISVLAVVAAVSALVVVPAMASTHPVITGLSAHRGPYWGGTSLTIRGENLSGASSVTFGRRSAWGVRVVSATELAVVAPAHSYDTVYVRVRTGAGRSAPSSIATFRFTPPSRNDPIQGGMTASQEQRLSSKVRARHHNVHIAHRSRHWTQAMGLSALRRAGSWIGEPYSWAGGNGSGPTTGVCTHNGGDFDCHIVGFDCSGLALYSWWPYEHLVHLASTQHRQAGRFHPSIGQLEPGDLVYFSGFGTGISHTAIYAGHGTVIQAPQSGETVMRSELADVIASSGVYRGATRPMTSGRQGSGPQITAVTKTMSATGGTLTITGRGLAGVTSVSVGHAMQYSFEKRSYGRLVLKAPAHGAGTVRVAISNAWGTVRRTVTYIDAPRLRSLSPSTGSALGGNVVTVWGNHLSKRTTATAGGVRLTLHVLSPTRATIRMPAHVAGAIRIVLGSPYGSSKARTYTYAAVVPTPTPTTSSPTTSSPTTSSPTTSSPTTSPPTSTEPTSSTPTPSTSTSTSSTSTSSTSTSTSSAPTSSTPASVSDPPSDPASSSPTPSSG